MSRFGSRMRWLVAVGLLVCCGAAVCGPALASPRQVSAVPACDARVSLGVLPVWARAGFSDPRPRIPHVLGRAGRIAAIIFGYPLLSPPSPQRANKILWVARAIPSSASSLRISAQRMDGTRTVGRPVLRQVGGGPGPSIINLPAGGCWRFTLHWSGRSDTLDLDYQPNQ